MSNITVCVTLQNTCEKLISAACGIRKANDNLFVLHVACEGQSFLGGDNDGKTLEFLYGAAQRAQADMTVLHAFDVVEAIVSFVREHKSDVLILGTPPQGESSLIRSLWAKLNGECRILLYDKEKGVLYESVSDGSRA